MRELSSLQLMLTRRCQLRCVYCPIIKRDADMSAKTLDRAVDFLFTSPARALRLDFTGGEPFLRSDLVRRAVLRAEKLSAKTGKKISFYAVTNALALKKEMISFLKTRDILLELSLDGGRRRHNRFKRPADPGLDPYAGTTAAIKPVREAGVKYFAVMVAAPESVRSFGSDFEHLYGLGIRNFDINYALGRLWGRAALMGLKRAFTRICVSHAGELRSGELRLGNFGKRSEPALLNSEVMVDVDGSLHSMSEWMFESSRSGGVPPFRLGTVYGAGGLGGIVMNKATAYYTLLTVCGGDARVKSIIRNNIETGISFSAFVEGLKVRLFSGADGGGE